MKVEIKWLKESLKFEGLTPSSHVVKMDTKPEEGKESLGPSPMELLLVALGGCTAMDVISILNKMREDVRDFHIEIESERAPEHPKYYTKIHLRYIIVGKNIKEENVKKAIELSQEKYCSVSANLRGKSEISFSYEIREVE